MLLSDACIKRPVLAVVLSLVLVLLGVCSYFYVDIRFFPKFEAKHISVSASYVGANSNLVESDVTNILENAISGVPGVKSMKSTSSRGATSIDIKLKAGTDVDETANLIRNKVSAAQQDLPDSVKPPTIQVGFDPDNFMYLAFTDPNMTPLQIHDYLQRYVVSRLLQVPGMASVQIKGADTYALRVNMNPDKLAASQLTVADIQHVILNTNLEMPSGEIKSRTMNYPVTTDSQLQSVAAFKNLVLKSIKEQAVHLGDVADVTLGHDGDYARTTVINNIPAIGVALFAQSDANPMSVAKATRAKLKEMQSTLPKGMTSKIFFDETLYLQQSIHEVNFSIIIAILCVLIAVFLFLGSPRAVVIPIATIPVCVISAYAVILLCGFTINVITLLAIVLSIGLVVDDAIVMLENIHRHIEKGLAPMEAAFKGSRQIAFSIIGMTVCLAAVYAPVGLVHGHVAVLFREFAFTLAGTVLISGFVSLTLSPMMCARLLSSDTLNNGYTHWLETFFEKLHLSYQTLLRKVLRLRLFVVIITIALAVCGVFLFKSLPKQFLPKEDLGFVITEIHLPTGVNFDFIKKQAQQVERIVKKDPNVKDTGYDISDQPGYFNHVMAALKPYADRDQTAKQVALNLSNQYNQVAGLNAYAFAPSPFSQGADDDIDFQIMTSGSYQHLNQITDKIKAALGKYKGLTNVDDNMTYDSQQYEIHINLDIASALGVNVQSIDNTISSMLGGNDVSHINLNNYRYNVLLIAEPKFLHNTDDLRKFYVRSSNGQLIPLSSLVTVKPVLGQMSLPHYNRLRSTGMFAELAPGYTIGDAVKYINQTLPKLLPEDTQYTFTGMAEKLQESNSSMSFVFILSIAFIFLVLAALFESFIDPFIVLLSVPLCIVGALFTLKLCGGTLNVYTEIALITLVGLISKHGILITQFINELKKQGKTLTDAICEGSATRLRPILMTTAAMVFGALPLLFTSGSGSQSRMQIGVVIISGLLLGTFFSLFVVPVAYSYLDTLKKSSRTSSR